MSTAISAEATLEYENTQERENMSFVVAIASSREIVLAADSRSTLFYGEDEARRHISNDRKQKIAFKDNLAVALTGMGLFDGRTLCEVVRDHKERGGRSRGGACKIVQIAYSRRQKLKVFDRGIRERKMRHQTNDGFRKRNAGQKF
jgi:20S proteasome alpha/beta subunit